MPGWTDDEMTALLSTDDMGEVITYTPAGGSAQSITCEWNEAFQRIDLVNGIVSPSPAARIRSADIATPKIGDVAVRAGVTYKMIESQPDGNGFTVLIFKKQ